MSLSGGGKLAADHEPDGEIIKLVREISIIGRLDRLWLFVGGVTDELAGGNDPDLIPQGFRNVQSRPNQMNPGYY